MHQLHHLQRLVGSHHREGAHLHQLLHLQPRLVGSPGNHDEKMLPRLLHLQLRLVGSQKEGGVRRGLSLVVGIHRGEGRVRWMEVWVWGSQCLCVDEVRVSVNVCASACG